MLSALEIREAEQSDAESILALQKIAYQSEAALYHDWSIPPLTQTLDDLRNEFSHTLVLKTQIADIVVGSVRANCENGVCAIGRLIVHPDHQRQGIGTRLMQAIEALFPSAKRFELFTGDRSEGNIRLYAKLGYRVIRSDEPSPTIKLVYMEKLRLD
ncbi:MAG: GNAT family N-acetyltransferase [Candidatus Acidiferrales bacterium]